MADRTARRDRQTRADKGLPALAERFVAAHGDRVLHGPFQGMRYRTHGDVAVGKLLGIYEREITPWLVSAAEHARCFVDLGAADGYFAAGIAFRYPNCPVFAFELSPLVRRELEEQLATNGLSANVSGRATSQALRELDLDRALVLCDIEGAEGEVFDDLAVAALQSAVVIVEVHDNFVPGVGRAVMNRFSGSHDCARMDPAPPEPADYPELAALPEPDRWKAIYEFRGTQEAYWLRFTPRA